ncbi:hypothetical protein ATE92_2451 [Ulvibacter sp. MAR_2010_11]|uniref:hypothetical protein n=1 Tax=Ulvibacter sp. MAR_2010_11 TaxID=1250229 RepID=UPI000C2CD3F8|nr:hypothetical protein [Ulvibacter sp. MAR_2010_11]PKA84271.1 hypothetical protein ATE92_2451 [Ulvibacter sp. MAR_2010_11]
MNTAIIEKIELDFTSIEIYENYLISRIKEGLVFEEAHLRQFYVIFEKYFAGKPFVSIADRKNDYTIDPNLLRDSRFSNLLGIGVICYSDASFNTALFEKTFFKGAFEPFYSLDDCISWALDLIHQYESE